MCIAINQVTGSSQALAGSVLARPASLRGNGAAGAAGGFTMIEMLVTVSIVAVLAAIAVPIINAPKSGSEANALLGALQYARGAAVQRGQNVVVCPSSNPTATTPTCSTGSSWSTGWIVLVPYSPNSCSAAGGQTGDLVLQIQQAFTSKDTATFTATSGNSNTAFCFTRYGFSYAAYTGLVEFNSTPAKNANDRCVVVSGVGHAQVLQNAQTDVNSVTCP